MQTRKMVYRHTILLLGLVFFTSCATTTPKSDDSLGRLVVGFDIDDTILYSEDNFLAVPPNPANPGHLDYAWVNSHDSVYSKVITDMAKLVHFFRAQGHSVYFITARPGVNGEYLARFLTRELGFPIVMDKNLFFSPKERDPKTGIRHTVKHRLIRELGIHVFYGDSDTDIVAALVGDAHPVRVVRDPKSLHAYSRNHFGDIISESSVANPFTVDDYRKFILAGVGPYGETIFPLYHFEEPLPGFETEE
ncbi:MAG: hypothetical protein K9N34_10270 [Candidatus Marinimicrobia bacterium]|nr:hypothetical protein [Candidatus Neomarinimicrobiota bacterium]MCF7840980.1 hypothetical protein [Candidatus Neomarinimicrobiota bacterium]